MLQAEPGRVVRNSLNEAVAVLTSAGWASPRPYTFQKHGLEIVFDTSHYIELYRQQMRVAEARVTSADEMRRFLRDNQIQETTLAIQSRLTFVMARPMKTRGFRKIIVDSLAYQWRFDGVLVIYADADSSNRGQKLVVDWGWVDWCEPEYRNRSPFDPHLVTPAFVQSAIHSALDAGWIPAVAGQPFLIAYADGEFATQRAT